MLKRKITLILSFFFIAVSTQAQGQRLIIGKVKDAVSQRPVAGVVVSLYRDTVLIAKSETMQEVHTQDKEEECSYYLEIPPDSATYTVRYEKEGYDTLEKTIHVKRFKKSETYRYWNTTYMMPTPKSKTLQGVTITATKIKFYHKDDTLIYNADAFNLPEGSMLDNLIKSMPGAELSSNGEITINGRRVDALLLNGEKFFRDKTEIMLENLPVYMVKHLKAYDKVDPLNKVLGNIDKGKQFILDVILKKQYSIGWVGNFEVGTGNEDRYLARLFGLRFTTASRIGAYANFNNLNDKRKPGENTNWSPEKMPTGLYSQKAGGIDYLIKPKFSTYKFNGSTDITYTDADNYSESTQETYLPQNSIFSISRSRTRSVNFHINSSHEWQLLKADEISGWIITPLLNYSRYNHRSGSMSATFDGDPYEYTKGNALFDSIQQMQGNNLRRMMINKYLHEAKRHGYNLNTNLGAVHSRIISGTVLVFTAYINYQTKKSDLFDLSDLVYPNNPEEPSQHLYKYEHNKPDWTLNYSFRSRLIRNMFGGRIYIESDIGQNVQEVRHSRYNLETLAGWGEGSDHNFGELPSEIEYLKYALDNHNSYNLHEVKNYISLSPKYELDIGSTSFTASLPVFYDHYRLNYTQGDVYSGITSKSYLLLSPQLSADHTWAKRRKSVQLDYNMEQNAPGMLSLIEIDNTSDPLNTTSGNSHVKPSTTHNVTLAYTSKNPDRQTAFNVIATYLTTVNSQAYIYTIDKSTGKRHYTLDNINGNYNANIRTGYSCSLDKKHKVLFGSSTLLSLNHGVDYINDIANMAPQRNTANTWWGIESVKVSHSIGKHSIGLRGYIAVGHATSSRADFNSYTLYNFNYGLTGLLKLPYGIELSTDMTMYSRRGYATGSANTNDLVWNARLSKTFLKAGITLAVDGFDILNQLSNVTQIINSQGRTETYNNALPRYIMAHMIYRFNKKPKK